MIGSNPKPYLKAWGVPVEKIETQDGGQITKRIVGIVSAPGKDLDFGGVRIVSDDYIMIYATADLTLKSNDKISVVGGPDVGNYKVEKVTRSSDGIFSDAKLAKIL